MGRREVGKVDQPRSPRRQKGDGNANISGAFAAVSISKDLLTDLVVWSRRPEAQARYGFEGSRGRWDKCLPPA